MATREGPYIEYVKIMYIENFFVSPEKYQILSYDNFLAYVRFM